MNSTLKSLVFWVVLVVVGVIIWNFSTKFQQGPRLVNFSEFMSSVDAGTVARVVVTGQDIIVDGGLTLQYQEGLGRGLIGL